MFTQVTNSRSKLTSDRYDFPESVNCQAVDLVHLEHIEQQIRCHDYILTINPLLIRRAR